MFNNLNVATKLKVAFSLVVFILLVVILIGYINLNKYSSASGWNIHTFEVLEAKNNILSALVNIETGQRGFLVAGKEEFLEPLNVGKKEFDEHFEQAKKLTSDNAKQQERLSKLRVAYEAWLKGPVESSLNARREIGNRLSEYGSVIAVVGGGKTGMDAMRVMIAEIDKDERSLLSARSKDMESLLGVTQGTLIGGGLAGVI